MNGLKALVLVMAVSISAIHGCMQASNTHLPSTSPTQGVLYLHPSIFRLGYVQKDLGPFPCVFSIGSVYLENPSRVPKQRRAEIANMSFTSLTLMSRPQE